MKKRLFIFEEDSNSVTLISKYLQGWDIVSTSSFIDAVNAIEFGSPYDLYILDVFSMGSNLSCNLLTEIIGDRHILLTLSINRDGLNDNLKHIPYIMKPIRFKTFDAKVKKLLNE